jgi:hypothetical protein
MKRCRAKRMDKDISKIIIISLTGWKLFYIKTESESQYAIVVDSRERT